jgi:hypothetical protein
VTLGMPAITEMALSGVTWPADKEGNQDILCGELAFASSLQSTGAWQRKEESRRARKRGSMAQAKVCQLGGIANCE